jgi:hypothetical protein
VLAQKISADATKTTGDCSPTAFTYTKSYKFADSRPAYYRYAGGYLVNYDDSLGGSIPVDATKAQGIEICKTKCNDSFNCRSVAWGNISFGVGFGNEYACFLSSAPYSPSFWSHETEDNSTFHDAGQEAYDVTNFRFPDDIILNGDFHTGCFKPAWQTSLTAITTTNTTSEIVNCKQSDKCPEDFEHYAHIYGTPSQKRYSSFYMTNEPVIHINKKYKLTFYALGTVGNLLLVTPHMTPNSDYNTFVTYNPTGKWQKITQTRVWIMGDYVNINVQGVNPGAGSPFDWKIAGITMEEA